MKKKLLWIILFCALGFKSCLQKNEFLSNNDCQDIEREEPNANFQTLLNLAGFGNYQIEESLVLKGQVVSHDASGQFYQELVIQPVDFSQTAGVKIKIGANDLHALYPQGALVHIHCKGLYISKRFGMVTLGFLNKQFLEPIPIHLIDQYLHASCEEEVFKPIELDAKEFNSNYLNRWVVVSNVQFQGTSEETFGHPKDNTNTIKYFIQSDESCTNQNVIRVQTSGFSNYKNLLIPPLKGCIKGVLESDYKGFYIKPVDFNGFEMNAQPCLNSEIKETISLKEIVSLYKGERYSFGNRSQLRTKVILCANNKLGNFPSSIVVQDHFENPSAGLSVMIDDDAKTSDWVLGQEIWLTLNQLYMDKIEGVLTIGAAKEKSLSPIEYTAVNYHLQPTSRIKKLKPIERKIRDCLPNTFVKIIKGQFRESELNEAYSSFSGHAIGVRKFFVCDDSYLDVLTEKSAVFGSKQLPEGSGSIQGIYQEKNDNPILKLRDVTDVQINQDRLTCEMNTSDLIIAQVADPKNAPLARYLTIFNIGSEPISLAGWKLLVYQNGHRFNPVEISFGMAQILNQQAFVISNKGFEQVFGVPPSHMSIKFNANGDEVFELVDPFGGKVDAFGSWVDEIKRELWHYTDGLSKRKKDIQNPSVVFKIDEWVMKSKSTGHILEAPEDFSPFSY